MLDRRGFLAGLAGLALSPLARAAAGAALGDLAGPRGLAFGSAFDRETFDDAPYAALLARECRIGTVENSLKFDWLRPDGPAADFSAADRLVDWAEANRLAPRGAALIWNDWMPPWTAALSAAEIERLLDAHIDETVGRYAGRMHGWDVVNEPFFPPHGRDGGYRMGPWFDALGPAYVARAFRRARAADPKARLFLNEAFCEQEDELGRSVRPRLLRLIDELLEAGAPVDAVGLQGHLKPQLPHDDAAFAAFVAEIGARGLDVWITELDVDDSGLPDDVPARDRAVAARLAGFLGAVLPLPNVKGVIAWHLSDRYSWYAGAEWYAEEVAARGGDPARAARTHLYDRDLAPKAAREAVAAALGAEVMRGPAP